MFCILLHVLYSTSCTVFYIVYCILHHALFSISCGVFYIMYCIHHVLYTSCSVLFIVYCILHHVLYSTSCTVFYIMSCILNHLLYFILHCFVFYINYFILLNIFVFRAVCRMPHPPMSSLQGEADMKGQPIQPPIVTTLTQVNKQYTLMEERSKTDFEAINELSFLLW